MVGELWTLHIVLHARTGSRTSTSKTLLPAWHTTFSVTRPTWHTTFSATRPTWHTTFSATRSSYLRDISLPPSVQQDPLIYLFIYYSYLLIIYLLLLLIAREQRIVCVKAINTTTNNNKNKKTTYMTYPPSVQQDLLSYMTYHLQCNKIFLLTWQTTFSATRPTWHTPSVQQDPFTDMTKPPSVQQDLHDTPLQCNKILLLTWQTTFSATRPTWHTPSVQQDPFTDMTNHLQCNKTYMTHPFSATRSFYWHDKPPSVQQDLHDTPLQCNKTYMTHPFSATRPTWHTTFNASRSLLPTWHTTFSATRPTWHTTFNASRSSYLHDTPPSVQQDPV